MSEVLDEKKRLAILDHELCHAQVVEDEEGNTATDHDGRPKWRVRKHDLEEFREIVARHGIYKQDILEFCKTAMERMGQPLLSRETIPDHDPETGEILENVKRVS
jgi:hypothetical protein